MLKALVKKQFSEIWASIFRNRKTGKARTKKSSVLILCSYILIFGLVSVIFYFLCAGLGILLDTNMPWLYYSFVSIFAVAYGTFGSVFNTYYMLYQAKDNDLLLSMPIPSKILILSRIIVVAGMSLLYESMVMVPAIIFRFLHHPLLTASGAVCSVFLLFANCIFITVITCLLGFVVALIASVFKNKTWITVFSTLIFIFLYYYAFGNGYKIIDVLIHNSEKVGRTIKTWLYPVYMWGVAGEGNILYLLILTAVYVILAYFIFKILEKSFLNIAKKSGSVSVNKQKMPTAVKARGIDKALLLKELKRFTSSSLYLLNCGLGCVFTLAAAVVIPFYSPRINAALAEVPTLKPFLPIICVVAVCLLSSTNNVAAPSISLEGKNLWILKSMPIDPSRILKAKANLQIAINLPTAIIFVISAGISFKIDFYMIVLIAVFVSLYVMVTSFAGVLLNLKFPNFQWTSEVVPIKQSMPVTISLFGCWILAAIIGAGGFFLKSYLEPNEYLIFLIVLFAVIVRLINKYIHTKAVKVFEEL